jgi:hypothetical protein
MRKIILLIACFLVWSPWASAQESASPGGKYQLETPFDGDVAFGYRWVLQDGNTTAGEYEYLHSSLAGQAKIEYDPLPNRFLFESYVNNTHDYFTEADYSYSDVVMFTANARKFYRNLHHWSIGVDDPLTASPSMTDFNPDDTYFADTGMTGARLRLKVPDFPFHLYLEAKTYEKKGEIQQRFMRSFLNGFSKASETRDIDYETREAKATINSHVNLVEIEYSHAEKTFGDSRDKSLTDATAVTYTHNQISDTESSTDTFKIHTSHTGRIAAAFTYSAGERKNTDSMVKADFVNAGGDFTWIPDKAVTVSLKYRHHEVSPDAPATVSSVSLLGTTIYSVKDAISYTRDISSGMVRVRATDSLTLRAEAIYDQLTRDFETGTWLLDKDITRLTYRLGATYRLTSRFLMRADASHQTANVPADSVDNTYANTTDNARGSVTWTPVSWYSILLSGGTTIEKRDTMAPPFTGSRETHRNRAQGSMTFVIDKKTAIIPSYAFFQNKQTMPIAYTDIANGIIVEDGVPYGDIAHLASLAVTHSLSDVVTIMADASRCWSRGSWQNADVVAGSNGIADYSNLNMVTNELGGEVQLHFNKNVGSDFRYRYRNIDDRLDDAEDGTVQIILATLTVTW